MSTIRAIFENGVFKPKDRVELPEKCEVEFEPRRLQSPAMQKVFDVLAERHDSGETDVAERHNEHQP